MNSNRISYFWAIDYTSRQVLRKQPVYSTRISCPPPPPPQVQVFIHHYIS